MAYLTAEEVQARVGGEPRWVQLTDDDANNVPDEPVVEQLLANVDAEADGYFRAGGYATPVTALEARAVKNQLLDIANYRAKTRGDREASPDDRQLYMDALAVLRNVALGIVLLDVRSFITASGDYLIDSDAPMFSRRLLRWW